MANMTFLKDFLAASAVSVVFYAVLFGAYELSFYIN